MTQTATRAKTGPTPRRDDVRKSRSRAGGRGTVGGVDATSAAVAVDTGSRVRRAMYAAAGLAPRKEGGRASRARRWLATWSRAYLAVIVHISVISATAGMPWPVLIVVYLAPAAATMVCRQDARRHWWRFPAALALTFVVYPGPNIIAFLIAEAYAIHEPWFRTTSPTDRRLIPKLRMPRPRMPRRKAAPARGPVRGKEQP